MLVLELWHRNFMESRTQWSAERRPPDIFSRESRQVTRSAAAAVSSRPQVAPN
jgi:hypothetical protein